MSNVLTKTKINNLLQILFNQVLQMQVKNEKEDLIKLALEIHKSFIQLENKENIKWK